MEIINKLLSQKEFKEYINQKKITRPIDKIILHHTHCTLEEWQGGERSIEYYKDLYEQKGWATGPHIFVAPEGIWLFTDINTQGTHANKGNKGSVGIEMVGRYNKKVPTGKGWEDTKFALKTLMKKLRIVLGDIHLHREYNKQKFCPGRSVTTQWLKSELGHKQ